MIIFQLTNNLVASYGHQSLQRTDLMRLVYLTSKIAMNTLKVRVA